MARHSYAEPAITDRLAVDSNKASTVAGQRGGTCSQRHFRVPPTGVCLLDAQSLERLLVGRAGVF
jgi:hypothetical protein